VSWSSKKQTFVALSTVEVEYVAAGQYCAQLLWMRQTLQDIGYNMRKVPLLCDMTLFYAFDHVSIIFFTCLFLCSSCTIHPRTSQVLVQKDAYGEDVLQFDPLRLMFLLEYL
jgi:hypothetical protein